MSSREVTEGLQRREVNWHNREAQYWNREIYSSVAKEEKRRKLSTDLAQRRIELEDQKKTDTKRAQYQKNTIAYAAQYAEERRKRALFTMQFGPPTNSLATLEPLGGYETSSIVAGPSPLVTRVGTTRQSAPYNAPKADFKQFRPPERVYASGGGRDLWSQNSIITNLGIKDKVADYSGRKYKNQLRSYPKTGNRTIIHNNSSPWNPVPPQSINPLAKGCKGRGGPATSGSRCSKKTMSRLAMPKYFKAKKIHNRVAPFSAGVKPKSRAFQFEQMDGNLACTHVY